ncbi:MAG: replicative DNA helicase [Anaerorhabdus sp.]
MNRIMPNSIEAEISLLGTLMVYPNSSKIAFEAGTCVEYFTTDANKAIFSAIEYLNQNSVPIEISTIITKLTDNGEIQRAGGKENLISICDAAVSSANIKSYVQILQNKHYQRTMIEVAQLIVDKGFSDKEIEDYLDEAEKAVLNVTRNRRTSEFKSGRDVISKVVENIHKMADNKSSITGVKTSFKDLDNLTHGLQGGDLIILAARPSMGKTAFALNLGMNIALVNREKAIAVFSLEMPAEQLISRILSAKSNVKGDSLRTGRLEQKDWGLLNEAVSELKASQIYIDDTPGVKVSEIFSKCRRLQSEHGLSCIIIDYIQLISGNSSKGDNRQQEVSEISRNLKALARELEVPVIALSQLSRNVESRADKKPMMSDLRESGSIEQDADIVMLMFRESYYDDEKKQEALDNKMEAVEINVAKHRNGATKKLEVAFKAETNAFYNIDRTHS